MPVTARATPNIAFIKYWGNRSNDLRLPAADSLSMTLDTPSVEITVDHADVMSVRSFGADGIEKILKKKDIARFARHLELTKIYLSKPALRLGSGQATRNPLPASVAITIHSRIPSSIGLASSAAVFGCLAKAYAGLISDKISLNDEQISVIARFGSGSAARSIHGGYVALIAGTGDEMDSSHAIQIADENHWLLHDIILVPTQKEKDVGSTEGHALASTSPYFRKRVMEIPRRQKECTDAILTKDFEKLQRVVEEDCWDMHNVMQSSTPPLKYLNDATYRITDAIEELRWAERLPVLYTMDAGPTVHLFCPEEVRATVLAFAKEQKDCVIFEAKTGKGATLLS